MLFRSLEKEVFSKFCFVGIMANEASSELGTLSGHASGGLAKRWELCEDGRGVGVA